MLKLSPRYKCLPLVKLINTYNQNALFSMEYPALCYTSAKGVGVSLLYAAIFVPCDYRASIFLIFYDRFGLYKAVCFRFKNDASGASC